MATLTEVSSLARTGVKWAGIGLVVLMLIPGILRLGKRLYSQFNPPPPPAPTVKYGKLPKLLFPRGGEETKTEYKLETIEGGLPNLPAVGKVYLVGINKSRLLTLDRIREKARLLGFVNEPVTTDEQTYKFIHPSLPAEMLTNIISSGFSYKLDWTVNNKVYSSRTIPMGNQAIAEAKTWLQSLGFLSSDLTSGLGKFKYLVATGSAMIPTDQSFDANFTRVDLFRADKDDLRIMTVGGDMSPVNVTFSGLPGAERVVQANYQYSMTLDNDFATYPLKSSAQGWNELTSGKGFVAKKAGEKVTVRKVSLGYFEASEPQDFLQPIFIFEGDGGFTGYVRAVVDQFVQ